MAKNAVKTDKVVEELKLIRKGINEKCKKIIDDELYVCSRSDGEVCNAYAFPDAKWRDSDCPLCDAELRTVVEEVQAGKVRVGQQKQKKHI